MSLYPFQEKVRDALKDKDKSLAWLLDKLDKSQRWFYNIKDFTTLELREIEIFSSALEINFIADYNGWKLNDDHQSLFIWSEPATHYEVQLKKSTLMLRLTATQQTIEESAGKMFSVIRKEGEKLGFEIE
jgi:hypothetical protein